MMTARQRVEAALIPRMLRAVAYDTTFSCFDAAGNVTDEAGFADLKRMRDLLDWSYAQPFDDLPSGETEKLKRRTDRAFKLIVGELEGQTAVKVALAMVYFVKELTDAGIIELIDGSPAAQAIDLLLPMAEYGLEIGKIDKSAQKQARAMVDRAREVGFYSERAAA